MRRCADDGGRAACAAFPAHREAPLNPEARQSQISDSRRVCIVLAILGGLALAGAAEIVQFVSVGQEPNWQYTPSPEFFEIVQFVIIGEEPRQYIPRPELPVIVHERISGASP